MADDAEEAGQTTPTEPPPKRRYVDPVLPQVRTRFQDWGEQLDAAKIPTGGITEVFEAIGRHQFMKMISAGLLPDSHVLDVGCGCLRAGFWLIHFLQPGRYCGIEPNVDMLEAGKRILVGEDIIAQKRPRFAHHADFSFDTFDTRFDFILARSIWSHASRAQIGFMLDQFKQCTGDDGVFLTSWIRALSPAKDYQGDTFSWPAIRYAESTIRQLVEERGLVPHVEETVQLQTWLRVTKR